MKLQGLALMLTAVLIVAIASGILINVALRDDGGAADMEESQGPEKTETSREIVDAKTDEPEEKADISDQSTKPEPAPAQKK